MSRNITTANSEVSFSTVLGLEQGEGYSADNIFTSEQGDRVETRIGVDGKVSAGYTPTIRSITFNFEASSRNATYFRNLGALMDSSLTPMPIVVTISNPAQAIRRVITGTIKNIKDLPDYGKVVEAWTAQIDYGSSDYAEMPM